MLVAIVVIGTITALGGSVAGPFASVDSSLDGSSGAGPDPDPDPDPSLPPAANPAAGMPELVCATGFAPGSTVTVNFNPVGPSLVSGGQIGTLTADSNGEVCEQIVVPVDAPTGDYSFGARPRIQQLRRHRRRAWLGASPLAVRSAGLRRQRHRSAVARAPTI